MRVRLHSVRQCVANNEIRCTILKSGDNRADIYTKPVTFDLMSRLTLPIRTERRLIDNVTDSTESFKQASNRFIGP